MPCSLTELPMPTANNMAARKPRSFSEPPVGRGRETVVGSGQLAGFGVDRIVH